MSGDQPIRGSPEEGGHNGMMGAEERVRGWWKREVLRGVQRDVGVNSVRGRRQSLGREADKSSRFSGKGLCAGTIGLPAHFCPEYIKELKCKSRK